MSDAAGKPTQIKNTHIRMMQEIVSFLQERGWDVMELNISRYSAHDEMDQRDEWRAKKFKWVINLSTAPQDQEDVKVREPSVEPQ